MRDDCGMRTAEQEPHDSTGKALPDAEDAERSAVRSPQSLSRRRALKVLGVAPLAGAMGMLQQQTPPAPQQPVQPHTTPNQPARDTTQPERAGAGAKRHFFTAKEMRTLHVLADDVIPADHRSPSATAVGVPAFIDYNLAVEETSKAERTAWRGGLRWLDTESRRRFGAPYAAATTAQRHALLDDISFPNGMPQGVPQGGIAPALQPGAAFFSRARDMIAAGFFSTPQGWKDLQYQGNVFNPGWKGCPQPALDKLGVSYAVMETRVKPEGG